MNVAGRLLVALLAVVLGLPNAAAAGAVTLESDSSQPSCGYHRTPHHAGVPACTMTKEGPASALDHSATYDAADRWLIGVHPRTSGPVIGPAYDYDRRPLLLHADVGTTTPALEGAVRKVVGL